MKTKMPEKDSTCALLFEYPTDRANTQDFNDKIITTKQIQQKCCPFAVIIAINCSLKASTDSQVEGSDQNTIIGAKFVDTNFTKYYDIINTHIICHFFLLKMSSSHLSSDLQVLKMFSNSKFPSVFSRQKFHTPKYVRQQKQIGGIRPLDTILSKN